MGVKPGYKQTDTGLVPKDWHSTTIHDIAIKVGSGITPCGGGRNYLPLGRPFVRSQNVGWGNLILDDLVFIDEATHSRFPATELKHGDVLLNITGASIGRSALASSDLIGGNVNQHVCVVRADSRHVSSSFLSYLLLSGLAQRQIDSFQAGGNRQGLNFGQIRSIKLPLPPTKAEQEAIAGALGDSDALIESLEQLLAKKRRIKQGAMQELLTGKKRLPGYTADWEDRVLGSLADMGSGGTPPSSNSAFYDGTIPWVSITDMTDEGKLIWKTARHLSAFGLRISAAQLFPPGTVLYAMYASLGECSIAAVPVSSSQAILGIRTREELDNEFLYYHLVSRRAQVKTIGQQGTQANLNKGMVQRFQLQLPSLSEQRAITGVLADMDLDIDTLEAKLTKARQIKQGMMQELLTGKTRLPVRQVA